MTNSFYTSVFQYGNRLLVRGYEEGVAFSRKVEFQPTLFVDSKKSGQTSKWKTLDGKTVYPVKPGSIKECKDFIEQYKDVHGFGIYGLNQYDYQYISETYPGDLAPDTSKIKIVTLDIETKSEYGFPNIQTANEEVLLISVMDNLTKNVVTFGCNDFVNTRTDVKYIKCSSEKQLLQQFIVFWRQNYPDVVTGWNVNGFDIPYLIRRCRYLAIDCDNLSPWGIINDYTKTRDTGIRAGVNSPKGETITTYSLSGIAILDYMELYKKFTFTARESYKLDYIAEVELNENKLNNPYDSFKEFYTNDPQLFTEYNIHDVYLVDKLEDRLKLIVLAYTLAYKAKVNFTDVYSPVRTWDILIYNYLLDKKITIPFKTASKSAPFVGGYVKDPIAGYHKWVASFDLTSLYPHIIMGYNMSPETITDTQLYVPIDDLVNKVADTSEAINLNLSMAGNGWCYRKDVRGFLPDLMDKLYKDRNFSKKQMLKLEQKYELTQDPALEKEIARLDTLQLAIKVTLNSGYGAVTNQYFRYYDMRIGEGITISGQLASRWIARKLNEFMNKTFKSENVDYVIYSDTDSIYLTLDKFIQQYGGDKDTSKKIELMNKFCQEIIQPYIDKSYNELAEYMNAYEQMMKMKLEVLADSAIFYKKKKYLLNVHSSEGVLYSEPKLKVKGLSMIQSSTPEICRDSLRESVKLALRGSESDIRKFSFDFKQTFKASTIEQISFPRGVSNITEFVGDGSIYRKGTPIHVRASLLYNHHLKRLKLDKKYPLIGNGDKIKFVYLKLPNPFYEDIIAFPTTLPKEFGLDAYVDYDTQFEKAFTNALNDLIEPMGWALTNYATLDEFF